MRLHVLQVKVHCLVEASRVTFLKLFLDLFLLLEPLLEVCIGIGNTIADVSFDCFWCLDTLSELLVDLIDFFIVDETIDLLVELVQLLSLVHELDIELDRLLLLRESDV